MSLRRYLLLPALLLAAATALAAAPAEAPRVPAASRVTWHLWNAQTLAEARASGRCVYVYIHAPLSELSRATVAQTFTSEKTAAWLNENFFCIFVDADAQPDLAATGQYFIANVKQLRGWPVHLWLTPDTLQPYDGANYLPPSEEWGKPGFLKSARAALDAWQQDPARARALAEEAAGLTKPLPLSGAAPADLSGRLEKAAAAWLAGFDGTYGGFGSAPKLPEPELLRFLLARGGAPREFAIKAARAVVAGALRDPVDGGFYRRCIDEQWKEPYYQKTLADQARIALALLEAADAAKDDKLRVAAFGALDFVLKGLKESDGTYCAALDGTLEENADPAKRPAFVRVGHASTGALGLLVAALHRTGEKRFLAEAARLASSLKVVPLPHVTGQAPAATAADLLAAALAFRSLKDDATATRLLAAANERYFDATCGLYQATPAQLPPGITLRVPATGDTPSAEVLALLAGVDAQVAGPIRHALSTAIEYDEQPAGDVLLGLNQK